MKQKLVLFSLLFAFVLSGFAQTSLDLTKKLPQDPDVITGVLDNGMKYYIRHNETPKNRAELTLVVKAGSIQEDVDQQGLAHFCEHMAFNGTKNFPKHELVNFLEKTGMKFGAEVNAYTSFDETVYGITVPLDSAEFLEKGLMVIYDWAHNVTFEGEEIDKERGVIHEEWRMHQGAQFRTQEQLFPAIFKGSKYADRNVIGLMSVVDSCEYDALRRFYKDWYRPDRQAVVVVGDFDAKEMEQKVKDLFNKIPKRENTREYTQVEIPDNKEPIIAIITDKETPMSTVQIFIKHPIFKQETLNDYRTSIMHSLYNGMISNRLSELTLSEDPPFIQGYSAYSNFIGPKDTYIEVAATKNDGIYKGAETILQENQRLKLHGFTQTELDREKKSLMSKIEKMYNDRNNQKSKGYVNEYKTNFLITEAPFPGMANEYNYYKQFLNDIKLSEVSDLAKKWIIDENMVFIISAPEKEGVVVPTEQEIIDLLAKVKTQKLEAYVDKVSTRPLFEDKDLISAVGKVKKKAKVKEFEAEEWTLSNGVKVVLKSTKFKEDEIKMTSYSKGGYSVYGQKDDISSKIAADIISESGLNGFDKIELDKLLSDKTVSVHPYIGELSEGINGNSTVKDFETMLQLTHLYFAKPRYDKIAYSSYMKRMKAQFENMSLSPESVFRDSVKSVLSSNNLRSRPMNAGILNEADYKRVHSIYRERFEDPSSFTFFFVGNIDLKVAKPLIEKYLGSLSNVSKDETWKDLKINYPKGKIDRVVTEGTDQKSIVLLQVTHDFDYSLKERMAINALGKILSINLLETIREEEGGVYSIGAYPRFSKLPTAQESMLVYFPCSPDNIEHITDGVKQVFKNIVDNGPTEENLEKAKKQILKDRETKLQENGFWINTIQSHYFNETPYSEFAETEGLVSGLTTEYIKEIAKKYLDTSNFVRVSLKPKE